MPATLTRAELDRLTTRLEGRIAKRLLLALIKAKQGVNLTKLERAILDRNYAAAVAAIGRERVLNALTAAQQDTEPLQAEGWDQIAKALPANLRRQMRVELTLGAYATQKPEVLEAIRRANLRRIQEITRETEEAIREQITRALEQGINPREAARELRDIVGLNRRQTAAVDAFRQRLRAEGRDPAQVRRMVQREAARQAQSRAENIARTETMSALNTGRQAQMNRLVNDGVIRSNEWEEEWVVADDEELCPQCEPFDGQRTEIGGVFTSLAFTRSKGPPLHPRCRCVPRLVLKGFREGASTPRQRRIALPTAPSITQTRRTATRRAGSRATDVEETGPERQRRLAFEDQVRKRKVEYSFTRTLSGTELRYQGSRRTIRFPDAHLAQMQGAPLFIHNHPNATPFSDIDMGFALGNRIELMRVVGRGHLGPVSYETDVGRRTHLSPSQVIMGFQIVNSQLFRKYNAILRERINRGMNAKAAADATFAEHLHEVWTTVAQKLGFRYIRRLDRQ